MKDEGVAGGMDGVTDQEFLEALEEILLPYIREDMAEQLSMPGVIVEIFPEYTIPETTGGDDLFLKEMDLLGAIPCTIIHETEWVPPPATLPGEAP